MKIDRITIIVCIFLVSFFYTNLFADTVYVLPSHQYTSANAYAIDGEDLVYSDTYSNSTWGGSGIAVDDILGFGYVTAEFSRDIQIFNLETMSHEETFVVDSDSELDLAGIVADIEKEKIYVMDRDTNHLYIMKWNSDEEEFQHEISDPYYIELDGVPNGYGGGAYGIALDELNDRLYIAANSEKVVYYDTDDWSHDPEN